MSENFKDPQLTFVVEKVLFGYLNGITDCLGKSNDLNIKQQEMQKAVLLKLLKGLQKFYIYYLSDSNQEEVYEKNVLLTMFTLGFASGEVKTVVNFKKDKKTCQKLL